MSEKHALLRDFAAAAHREKVSHFVALGLQFGEGGRLSAGAHAYAQGLDDALKLLAHLLSRAGRIDRMVPTIAKYEACTGDDGTPCESSDCRCKRIAGDVLDSLGMGA